MKLTSSPKVSDVFDSHPVAFHSKMKALRDLIIEVAEETNGLIQLEETLKWGEPSYLTKHGSTIRINIKKSEPMRYAMYLNCKSRLVETYRMVFGDLFTYEDNRAVVFNLQDDLPIEEVKKCISMALRYHKIKDLPLLGE